MTTFHLKTKAELIAGNIYSICLRGARKLSRNEGSDIAIYLPNEDAPIIASIESQKQFSFVDVLDKDCKNNYDTRVRTWIQLNSAMLNVYNDFDSREIVTIVNFRIN